MQKKTKIRIIVAVLLLVGFGMMIWLGIFQKVGKFTTLQAVPADAVFKVNVLSVNSMHERLRRNFIWQSLKDYPYFKDYHSDLQYIDSLGNANPGLKRLLTDRPVTISCHLVTPSHYDFLYICDLGRLNVIKVFESLLLTLVEDDNIKVKTLKDSNGEIRELNWGDLRFYFAIKDNLLIGSLARPLLSRSLAKCKEKEASEKGVAAGDMTLDVDYGQLSKWMASIMTTSSGINQFSLLNNTRLMLQLNDKNLHFLGETKINPESFSVFEVLNFVSGGTSSVKEIAGENTAAYVSFCFPSFRELEALLVENHKVNNTQSYNQIEQSVRRINKFLDVDVLELFTSWIGGEVAIIKPRLESGQKADNVVLAVRSKDIDLAKDQMSYLAEQIQRKTPICEKAIAYNGHSIHYFRLKGFFNLFFEGMFERFERPYYTFLGDFVVFSNSPATLAEMIKEYVLENTLAHDEKYNQLMGTLGNKNNVFSYMQLPNTYEYLYSSFKPDSRGELEKNKGAFLSFEMVGFTMSKKDIVFETQIVANYNDKAPEEFKLRKLNRELENQIDEIEAGFYYPVIPDSIAVSTQDRYTYETEQNSFSGGLKDGDPDGIWDVYNNTGKLIGQFPYKAGVIDGVASFFYEDGAVLAYITYEDGAISEYKEFFLDGTLRAAIAFRKGVRHGTANFYYNTGHLYCEGKYKKGRHSGKWRYYKVTGEKYTEV